MRNQLKTRLTTRLILLLVGASLLLPANASCSRTARTVPDGLKVDHLGESLREFRSVHRKAYCRRAQGEWDEDEPKKAWLLWIHCSLETGVTFGGYKLLCESEPRYPFGAYATFYRKRLVAITYTLSTANIESLVSLIGRGRVSMTKVDCGVLTGVSWSDKGSSIVIQLIPIRTLKYSPGLLRVTNNVVGFATSVSFTSDSETEY